MVLNHGMAMIKRGASLGDHHLKDYWSRTGQEMSGRLHAQRNTDRKYSPGGAAKRASECPPDIAAMRALGVLQILPH